MTHQCHAIKITCPSLKLCRNYAKTGSMFCGLHQDISPEEHKRRWVQKFLLGADGKPFLFRYDEQKQQRILGDLRDGIITLSEEDIQGIPNTMKLIDIYLLLFEHDYIGVQQNAHPGLYLKTCLYLTQFLVAGSSTILIPYHSLARRIVDTLILKDADHLLIFLQRFLPVLKTSDFQGDHSRNKTRSFFSLLNMLLESQAAAKLSWNPFRDSLLKEYTLSLGEAHPTLSYLKEVIFPWFVDIYKEQKKKQKDKIDSLKEELMAVTWHPDRFQEWCLDEEEKAENKILFG